MTKVIDFGCFVELDGVRGKVREGLVHVGQVRLYRCVYSRYVGRYVGRDMCMTLCGEGRGDSINGENER